MTQDTAAETLITAQIVVIDLTQCHLLANWFCPELVDT